MSSTNGTAIRSKAEAIRKILAAKGGDKLTAPEVVAKVKEKFGIEVGTPSVYQEWRLAKQRTDEPAVEPKPAAVEPAKPSLGLDAVLVVKEAAAAAGGVEKLEEALAVVKEAAAKAGGVESLEAALAVYKKIVG